MTILFVLCTPSIVILQMYIPLASSSVFQETVCSPGDINSFFKIRDWPNALIISSFVVPVEKDKWSKNND